MFFIGVGENVTTKLDKESLALKMYFEDEIHINVRRWDNRKTKLNVQHEVLVFFLFDGTVLPELILSDH